MSRLLLLAEDNRDDELLTLRAIRKLAEDIDVVVVHDGAEAAEFLGLTGDGSSVPQMPDLAIIDIKMPKVSGLELLEKIRTDERTALLPVIVFSSSNEETDISEAIRLGAVFEQKPVDYGHYLDRIQQVLRIRFLESALFFEETSR